jgi:hypothetical protein
MLSDMTVNNMQIFVSTAKRMVIESNAYPSIPIVTELSRAERPSDRGGGVAGVDGFPVYDREEDLR